MRYIKLRKLNSRLYFTYEDVADVLGIGSNSAKVLCTRYSKIGLIIRLKKNLYTLKERWEKNSQEDFFKISNILQVPSYISLMTALSYYEITTQVQRGVIESVCVKRTLKKTIENTEFNFYKINRNLYFDFLKKDDFFIASKEKAFVDAVYLYSFGKYSFDFDSIDISKLDMKKIKKIIKVFPERTKQTLKKICKI
jgi:predicted transcriptional regulator of viral defense system